MSQQKRQSNLYAGEDWTQVYESFYKINLTAYDFDTIRQSMIDYLRQTYPDSFNDWIENDQFIFILDTIAMLGQNLAFRMDLNTRENFLDTASRRASVLKLAKMISYSPRRAYPGRATAKLTEIKTNQDVRNSYNESLKDKIIRWNDPMDSNWYENFILVMNSAFVSTNQFGNPVKRLDINGVSRHLYRMNTLPMSAPNLPFTATVNGESMTFEVVNPDINVIGVDERHPEPQEQKYIVYQNDGNGFSSPNTGFFVYFIQGTLQYQDFQYDVRQENRIQDINVDNINETDVWVQEITEDGIVRTKWTKVPSMESIAYNTVTRQLKTIYAVTTRDRDQISIKFPDSRSGVVPRGTYRVWYRVSNGETYNIKTADIQNKSVKYIYRTKSQSNYENSTLDIKFSLQFESDRAQSAETLEQIKARAPQMYYTQNRFVNGEDYNIAPLSQGNAVLKSKAINRIYSGQSRFIDINDPTGKYQNTDVFSDDGAMYKNVTKYNKSVNLPSTKSNSSIVIDDIQPLIGENAVIQKYQAYPQNTVRVELQQNWVPSYSSSYATNTYGRIIGATGTIYGDYKVGTLIKFGSSSNNIVWASIVSVLPNGFYVLSTPISSSMQIQEYISPYRTRFNTVEVQNIAAMLDKKTNFILIYDIVSTTWVPLEMTTTSDTITYNGSLVQVMVNIQYTAETWEFDSNGVEYVFVGGEKVRFYFVSSKKITDISTGSVQSDKIEILSSNSTSTSNVGLTNNIDFQILDTIKQENGYLDGSRVVITSESMDSNGIPLNPNQFQSIVPDWTGEDSRKYGGILVFQQNEDFTISSLTLPNSSFTIMDSTWNYTMDQALAETNAYKRQEFIRNNEIRSTTLSELYSKGTGFIIAFQYEGQYYFIEQTVGNNNDRLGVLIQNMTEVTDPSAATPETAFYRCIKNMGTSVDANKKLNYYGYKDITSELTIKTNARTSINFHWKHYAPDDNRIDPSRTNLIDMYVLTNSYKTEVDIWLKNGAKGDMPKPPTSVELQDIFKDVEKKTVISDSLIWHSAEYLPLFGNSAAPDYKADFKVVKLPNSTMSDDEIRQNIVSLTNQYFAVENWDFGESFYYTDLCTYLHTQLGRHISTVVIVAQNPNSKFGSLFEIPSRPDQIFISTATVDNVQIVNSLAKSNINIGF
ncbi:baseplate wedge [Escherichia phage A4]|nr:baseplate wedge [Escherichia phage A4]